MKIPIVEIYRGIGLHDHQDETRLAVVRVEIDQVFGMTRLHELFDFLTDIGRAPESRMLAAAKLEAVWELAAEDREARPAEISLPLVRAHAAGLDSELWRSPWSYGTIVDPPARPGKPGAVLRITPLPDLETRMRP